MPEQAAPPSSILIIDDHVLFREALSRMLATHTDVGEVVTVGNVKEGLEVIRSSAIDIVLLDINLGGGEQGTHFLTQAKNRGFKGQVLVVTAGVSDYEAARLLQKGCSGIFLKTESPDLLLNRIRQLRDGEAPLDALSMRAMMNKISAVAAGVRPLLTQRERDVLRLVYVGLSTKEIADKLSVSESLVKAVLQQLFSKTGVRTRAQLVRIAMEQYWEDIVGKR